MRRIKCVRSKRWHLSPGGNLTIKYRDLIITIFAHRFKPGYSACADGTFSKRVYPTAEAAKIAAFNFLFRPARNHHG